MRPHDPVPPGIAYPVDPWTGHPLKPVTQARIARLKEASEAFLRALHDLDGTSYGTRPGDPRMASAFTKVDEAVMWATWALLTQETR